MTSNELPPKPQRDVIREVDWLAVAPWTLLFRIPQAMLGWPLIVGVLGGLTVGGFGTSDRFDYSSYESFVASLQGDNFSIPFILLPNDLGSLAIYCSKMGVWFVFGLAIMRLAAPNLMMTPREGLFQSLLDSIKRWPQAMLSVLLLFVPVLVFLGLLLLFCALEHVFWQSPIVLALHGPVALLIGVPLVLFTAIASVGTPLALAAAAIDRADAFDAASRAIAYTTQCVMRLVWYVAVALAIGYGVVYAVETLIIATQNVMPAIRSASTELNTFEPMWVSMDMFRSVVRGAYPAYCFTAAAVIYLLLRRDIDGQPLDEISHAEGAA